ncbi:MAG: protein-disulfide reductase DsbD N-terminal domain-containing protein [Candidatus Solibacter sp.]|nr:protein-disulfide reductase DsbD N-terminal domain-containing protein [Candidatus Solibacter sp.]
MRRLFLTAVMAACLGAAPADPVVWKLQNPPAVPVKAGARFNVKLLAAVQEGWHLYSLKPMAEGPIPTRIWLAEGQPFSLAGAVLAPDPQVMQDASFGMEVELYEGEAVFTLPVRVVPAAALGAQKLVVSASYQTCNNKLCLPPKTVKLEVPVTIGK